MINCFLGNFIFTKSTLFLMSKAYFSESAFNFFFSCFVMGRSFFYNWLDDSFMLSY